MLKRCFGGKEALSEEALRTHRTRIAALVAKSLGGARRLEVRKEGGVGYCRMRAFAHHTDDGFQHVAVDMDFVEGWRMRTHTLGQCPGAD